MSPSRPGPLPSDPNSVRHSRPPGLLRPHQGWLLLVTESLRGCRGVWAGPPRPAGGRLERPVGMGGPGGSGLQPDPSSDSSCVVGRLHHEDVWAVVPPL